jgi:hypothetical protein
MRLTLQYHLHIQPSELEKMNYYEYEYMVEDLQEFLKEKNKNEEKAYENINSSTSQISKMNNMNNIKYKKPVMPNMKS